MLKVFKNHNNLFSHKRFSILALVVLAFVVPLIEPVAGAVVMADTFSCTPTEAAVFTKAGGGPRIHVRCSTDAPPGGIYWFAYGSKKTPSDADRFLNLITFAIQNTKTLRIWYDQADLSGDKIGCQTGDCRLIQAISVY
jgi:hypothetical protein